jgi:uncharacterized protein
VSHENVEIVRRAHEAFERGGFAETAALLHPEFAMDQIPRHPEAGTYPGETAAKSMNEWVGAFEDFRAEPEEFIDAGDRVVVVLHEHGRARGSTSDLDHRYGIVYTLRDKRIARMQWFNDKAEALEAVGLEERDARSEAAP